MIARILQDLRITTRSLAKRPGYTTVVLLTLALSIGAPAAIFTVVDGVLLSAMQYRDPDRLTRVLVNTGGPGWHGASGPEFADYEARLESFENVAAYRGRYTTLGGSTAPLLTMAVFATADLLPMLGVTPALGRTFSAEEDRPGGDPVIVLSYGLWVQLFGGDPEVLGRTVKVNGSLHTVIGVMPRGFNFPSPDYQAWLPLQLSLDNPLARTNHDLDILARLGSGVPMSRARAEVGLLAQRSFDAYPEFYAEHGYRIRLQTLRDQTVGESGTPLLIILGAALFLLLAACVTVANLVLARGETRKREVAVRTALGAPRMRLTGQLLTEHMLLAVVGGLGGVALAFFGVRALIAADPGWIPRLWEVGLDARTLGFSFLLVLTTGLAFGLAPALKMARADISECLKEGVRSGAGSGSSHRLRRTLVVTQVAFAVVLATGVAIMVQTVRNLYRVDLGFRPDHVLTMRLVPSFETYGTAPARVRFYEDALRRVRILPGVTEAAAVSALPLAGEGASNWSYLIAEQPDLSIGDAPFAPIEQVTPGYLDALGLTLVRGRFFNERDGPASPAVAVINEAMARTHWSEEDPLGKRIKVFDPGWPWMEVVGVVKDVRGAGLDREARPLVYVPHAQGHATAYLSHLSLALAVKTEGDPTALAGPIRDAVWGLDADVPIPDVATMGELIAASVADRRFTMLLLSGFGLVALFLASVGVYGVISFVVSQRTHEIGIRMALGARGARILRQVVGEGLLLALLGVTLGLVGALFVSRVFQPLVFGVAVDDPITYLGVAVMLILTAVCASFAPALRAARLDPLRALRANAE
jgi:putative ABC transport system permease protein